MVSLLRNRLIPALVSLFDILIMQNKLENRLDHRFKCVSLLVVINCIETTILFKDNNIHFHQVLPHANNKYKTLLNY